MHTMRRLCETCDFGSAYPPKSLLGTAQVTVAFNEFSRCSLAEPAYHNV